MQAIFDGHNDVLLRLWLAGDMAGDGFVKGNETTDIDLPRARSGGMGGGFFAMFVPVLDEKGKGILSTAEVAFDEAARITAEITSIFHSLRDRFPQDIRCCLNAADVAAAHGDDALAVILHIEGAEAVHPSLDNLEALYADGVRSIGPVWSRANAFGCGVPFGFPGSPDQGPGLSGAGRDLVRACNRLGIMIDLSHMNAAGFWDVAAITDRPLIATHSNVHALSPTPRNLTDDQLDAIADSGGLVGASFVNAFLREDGAHNADTPLEIFCQHLDHLLEHLGADGVALGSDFDGALVPDAIGDVAGVQAVVGAMRMHGYDDDLIDRICWRNWQRQIAIQISS